VTERVFMLDDRRMIVMRSGPHAGTLSIVNVTGQEVPRTFTPPVCDEQERVSP
jgi:hypothetical protein